MNLATDNLNKTGIFKIMRLEYSTAVLILSYLRVLTVSFCNLIKGSKVVLLALPLLSIE